MFRCLSLTAAVLFAAPAPAAPVPKTKPEAFQPPDAKTIAAVRESGGEYGVMYEGATDGLRYAFLDEANPNPDTESRLPAFSFDKWPEAGLPEIAVPFGLQLDVTTDIPADLGKTAAKWKNLRALRLRLWVSTDKGMECVTRFAALPDTVSVHVQFLNCGITDEGLAKLKVMRCMTALTLHFTEDVTDRGLAHLAKLERLTSLSTVGTKLTATGFKHLQNLKNLDFSRATDETTRGIGELTQLEALLLHGDGVSEERLAELGRLKNLRCLNLSSDAVTAARLRMIAGMTRLRWLDLPRTKLTDAGLATLAGLPELTELKADFTKVTAAGRKAFRATRPGCTFEFNEK